MLVNDYSSISKSYASLDNSGTAYLAFKTIPASIKKYSLGKKTLDYGCGAGDSTLFLNELGLDVQGDDISFEMLQEATALISGVKFELIKSGQLPYDDNIFDIVFSSFVLFEIATKKELKVIIDEIYRVLKKGGIFIAVTGSEELYSHQWLSLDVNFDQNKNLSSGDIAKVLLKDANLVVYDYFWTDKDYKEVFCESEFFQLQTDFPRGDSNDGYKWVDEIKYPPYAVYKLLKK